MTPYEYMLATRETAIYPKEVALPYLVLGLVGEIGELKSAIYSGSNVTKEAGDILWYAFRLTDEVFGTLLTDNDRKKGWRVFDCLAYYDDSPIDEMYYQSSLVAEIVKKAVRDNNGTVHEERIRTLASCLNKIVDLVSCVLKHHSNNTGSDYSIEQCAIANIEKLQSRKSRNVIGGSGDER